MPVLVPSFCKNNLKFYTKLKNLVDIDLVQILKFHLSIALSVWHINSQKTSFPASQLINHYDKLTFDNQGMVRDDF